MVDADVSGMSFIEKVRSWICCFFFKQKAAYEIYKVTGVQTCALPISVLRAAPGRGRGAAPDPGGPPPDPRRDADPGAPGCHQRAGVGVPGLAGRPRGAAGVGKIGRASCRERSVDLGGRRILIKKKTRQ